MRRIGLVCMALLTTPPMPGWAEDAPHAADVQATIGTSDPAAVDRLMRQVRIQVYRTFHADRAEFDRRRGTLDALLAAWADAGRPATQQQKVIDWLETALRRSTPPELGPLPPLPSFDERPGPPSSTAGREPAGASAKPTEPPVKPTSPATPDVRPATPPRGGMPPVPIPPAPRPAAAPLSDPRPPRLSVRGATSAPDRPVVSRPMVPDAEPALPEPQATVAALAPAPRPLTPQVVGDHLGAPVPRTAVRVVRRASTGSARHQKSASPEDRPSEPAVRVARRPVASDAPASKRPAETPIASPPKVASLRPELPPRTVAANPQPPAADARVAGVPRSSAGVSALSPRPLGNVPSSPPSPSSASSSSGQTASARVNLRELTVQIAGNNLAIEKLAAELESKPLCSAGELEVLIERTTILLARRDDLKLYWDALSAEEQQQVGRLNSGSEVVSLLGAQIARARVRVRHSEYPGGQAAREADAKRLDALSRQLSDLVFGEL